MSGSTPSSASSSSQPPFEVRKVGEIGQPIEVFVKMGQQTYKFSYIPPEGYAVTGSTQADQIEKIRTLATDILKGLGADKSTILQKTEKMDFKFTEKHEVTSIEKSSNGTPSAGFKEDETIQKVKKAFETFQTTSPIEKLTSITPPTADQGGIASQVSGPFTHVPGSASLTAMDDTVAVTTPIAGSSTTASRGVCGLKPLTQRKSSETISIFEHTYTQGQIKHVQEIPLGITCYKDDFIQTFTHTIVDKFSNRPATEDEITTFQSYFANLPSASPYPKMDITEEEKKRLPKGLVNPAEACYVHSAVQLMLGIPSIKYNLFKKLQTIKTSSTPALNTSFEGLTPADIVTVKSRFKIQNTDRLNDDYNTWDLSTNKSLKKCFIMLDNKQAATIAEKILEEMEYNYGGATKELDAQTTQVLKMCLLKLQNIAPQKTEHERDTRILIPHVDNARFFKAGDPESTLHVFSVIPNDSGDIGEFFEDFLTSMNIDCQVFKTDGTEGGITLTFSSTDFTQLHNIYLAESFNTDPPVSIKEDNFAIELAIPSDNGKFIPRNFVFSNTTNQDEINAGLYKLTISKPEFAAAGAAAADSSSLITLDFELDSFSVLNSSATGGGHNWTYRRINLGNTYSPNFKWIRIDDRENPIVSVVDNREIGAALSGAYKNVFPCFLHFSSNTPSYFDTLD